MPRKNKNRKTSELNPSLGRESLKKIRNDKIQGTYLFNKDVYSFYCI